MYTPKVVQFVDALVRRSLSPMKLQREIFQMRLPTFSASFEPSTLFDEIHQETLTHVTYNKTHILVKAFTIPQTCTLQIDLGPVPKQMYCSMIALFHQSMQIF